MNEKVCTRVYAAPQIPTCSHMHAHARTTRISAMPRALASRGSPGTRGLCESLFIINGVPGRVRTRVALCGFCVYVDGRNGRNGSVIGGFDGSCKILSKTAIHNKQYRPSHG